MPASDFTSHDPAFSAQQTEQCARIAAGVRTLNARIMRLSGSLESLTAAAEQVEALLASLDEVTQSRALQTFRFAFDRDHPNGVLPFNPATGTFNPIAPLVEMALEGEMLVAHAEFASCHEGGPDTVQGGMLAALYDQLLAYAVMNRGRTGPTLWLKVSYLKPTPIHRRLRFECAVESVDGRKFLVTGSCHCGDEKLSEAQALMLAAYPLEVTGGEGLP
jgi:acyl-coenzyme A thioesterase PaaI-like protein